MATPGLHLAQGKRGINSFACLLDAKLEELCPEPGEVRAHPRPEVDHSRMELLRSDMPMSGGAYASPPEAVCELGQAVVGIRR